MLVRRRAGVDDIVATLESLVMRRVPEQPVHFFECGDDLLAARGGVTPDDVLDRFVAEQVFAADPILVEIASRVFNLGYELEVDAGEIVDLFDCQKRTVQKLLADRAVRTGERKNQAHWDCRLLRLGAAHRAKRHVCLPYRLKLIKPAAIFIAPGFFARSRGRNADPESACHSVVARCLSGSFGLRPRTNVFAHFQLVFQLRKLQ